MAKPVFVAFVLTASAASWPGVAAAQTGAAQKAAEPDEAEVQKKPARPQTVENKDILVQAPRLPGSLETDVLPIEVLDADAIASYGASSLGDLVEQLSSKTQSKGLRGASPPVILLGGRRISAMSEISAIPPEAILGIEIFPEAVAIEYGFAAEQRVVNIMLRPKFKALTSEAQASSATAGGYGSQNASISHFRVVGDSRMTLTAQFGRKTAVSAASRNIQSDRAVPLSLRGIISNPLGGEIDPSFSARVGRTVLLSGVPLIGRSLADFADAAGATDILSDDLSTLSPASQNISFDASITRPLSRQSSLTATLGYSRATQSSSLGLSPVTLFVGPGGTSPFSNIIAVTRIIDTQTLTATSKSSNVRASMSMTGALGRWTWVLTSGYGRTANHTKVRRGLDSAALQARVDAGADPFAVDFTGKPLFNDQADYFNRTFEGSATFTGPSVELPAGPVRIAVQAGWNRFDLFGSSRLGGLDSALSLSRSIWALAVTIEIPLSSRASGFLPSVGDLSFSLRLAERRFSDAGALPNSVIQLNWSPALRLNIAATWIGQKDAPSIEQLGAPIQVTPLRVLYDVQRGETVIGTLISGGNPNLKNQNQHDFRLQASWKPLSNADLSVSLIYANARATNTVAAAPAFSQAFETSFPDRVQRDAMGRLLSLDQRPVGLFAEQSQQIGWTLNYTKKFGPRASQGHWSIAISHNVSLLFTRQYGRDGSILNLLSGAAVDASGGQPRHILSADGSWFRSGLGLSLNGNWRSGSIVRGQFAQTGESATKLKFSSRFMINTRVFVDLNHRTVLVRQVPFFRNGRLSFGITNLLARSISVSDANGFEPFGYQRGYLDPFGRTIDLSFRKQF
jgi:iron complex outermembrane recepter protein